MLYTPAFNDAKDLLLDWLSMPPVASSRRVPPQRGLGMHKAYLAPKLQQLPIGCPQVPTRRNEANLRPREDTKATHRLYSLQPRDVSTAVRCAPKPPSFQLVLKVN